MSSATASAVKHGVVPDVIDKAPKAIIKVDYNSGVSANLGDELTPTQVQDLPKISWDAEKGALYTLAMVDPDGPSREKPEFREVLHYLVGNIPGIDIDKGTTLCEYIGSGPPKGTGLHRYIWLVYKQPGPIVFSMKPISNRSREGRLKFSIGNFSKEKGLGEPVAVNFYQAQFDDYVPILHAQLDA